MVIPGENKGEQIHNCPNEYIGIDSTEFHKRIITAIIKKNCIHMFLNHCSIMRKWLCSMRTLSLAPGYLQERSVRDYPYIAETCWVIIRSRYNYSVPLKVKDMLVVDYRRYDGSWNAVGEKGVDKVMGIEWWKDTELTVEPGKRVVNTIFHCSHVFSKLI
jgi:hypothetical protein